MSTMTRPLYRDYKSIEADLPALLEIARIALQDGDLFDTMGDNLDLCDEEMIRLRDNLESFMQADIPAGSAGSPLARALAAVPELTRIPGWNDSDYLDKSRGGYANLAGQTAYWLASGKDDKPEKRQAAYDQAYQAVYQEG